MLFTTQDRSSSILRNNETRDQFGRRQTEPSASTSRARRSFCDRTSSSSTGARANVIYQRTFKEENQSGANQQTPPLSSYFDLMDRLIPTS